jgi:siroheme synthase-like protein
MGLMIDVQPSAGVALVVGGGRVAARKVGGLVDAGFAVEVVAPAVSEAIGSYPGVVITRRRFEPADVAGHALLFACTNDPAVNAIAVAAARRLGILALAADDPEASSFHSVAVHRDGALLVGVSTSGAAPAVAAALRDRAAAALGNGWAERLEEARRERAVRAGTQAGRSEGNGV